MGKGAAARDLTATLAAMRSTVGSMIRADGPDAHQIDVDRLVWAHAHAEAALACADWAAMVTDRLPAAIADCALREATLQIGLDGSSEIAELDHELAQLVDCWEPLEDLGTGDETRMFRSTVRQFADREIRPHARDIHRQDRDLPESIITGAATLGLFGLSVPTAFGGALTSPDSLSMLVATEELSRASLAAGGSLITRPEILVRALLRGGTEEQKQRWLPAIASGRMLVAVAVTEPDFGSDVGNIQCRATRLDDGSWEIHGAKLWCTFAGRSELLMVLCRTADRGHRGLSVFVLEKPPFGGHDFEYQGPAGGAMLGHAIPTIGYRGMHTFELAFDRFRVPAESLLGGEEWLNRGFYLQMEGFSMGRIQTASRAVGVMQAALEDAIEYASSRSAFGRPLMANQLLKAKLGRMAMYVNVSRQLSYRAARLIDAGSGQMEASLAKLYACSKAETVTRDAVQIYGGMGYSEETDVSRYFVDARVLTIFEGTEEVLSLRVIGKALLDSVLD